VGKRNPWLPSKPGPLLSGALRTRQSRNGQNRSRARRDRVPKCQQPRKCEWRERLPPSAWKAEAFHNRPERADLVRSLRQRKPRLFLELPSRSKRKLALDKRAYRLGQVRALQNPTQSARFGRR